MRNSIDVERNVNHMDLLEIRDKIDVIDKEIEKLFEDRMELCKNVAEYKISVGKAVLDKQREIEKIEKIKSLAHGEFNQKGAEEIFKQIMAISRKLQYQILASHNMLSEIDFIEVEELEKDNIKVVYQGVEGAYAYEAMINFFGEDVENYNVETWKDAMEAVKCGDADYAVIPIENSTAGSITQVYDLLANYDNYIVGAIDIHVNHMLLGIEGATLSDVKTVYSHPQALMQCEKYLEENKQWQKVSLANTAVSAQKVKSDGDVSQAAIASRIAAKLHGLTVLKENINHNTNNTTRFIVVSNKKIYVKDAKKVSVCFEIPHEKGSLYSVLSHFIYNNVNMTSIESRPVEGKTWEYRFTIDVEGNLSEAGVKNALRGINEETLNFKILGNY